MQLIVKMDVVSVIEVYDVGKMTSIHIDAIFKIWSNQAMGVPQQKKYWI